MIVLRSALRLIKIKCPFYEASKNICLFVFLWSEINRKLNLKLSLTAKPNTILCSSFDFVRKISLFLVFHRQVHMSLSFLNELNQSYSKSNWLKLLRTNGKSPICICHWLLNNNRSHSIWRPTLNFKSKQNLTLMHLHHACNHWRYHKKLPKCSILQFLQS